MEIIKDFIRCQNLKPIPCILHKQYFSRHNFTISLRYLINYTRTHRWFLTKGCGLPIHPCRVLFLLLFIFIFLLYLSFARVILFFKLWLLIGVGFIIASENKHMCKRFENCSRLFKGVKIWASDIELHRILSNEKRYSKQPLIRTCGLRALSSA